ncbi:WYL domain-containing protein [Modestobacter sp. SYSU DS0875]
MQAVKGPDGGYRLAAGAQLPPLLFDDDQAVALAVALRVAAASGAGITEATARALATVRQVMLARLRHRVDAIQVTPVPADDGQVDPALLVALTTAIRAREVLRFDHAGASSGDDPAQLPPLRRVEPHHLVNRAGRWYLVGWDLDRADWRTFRVDRISPRTPPVRASPPATSPVATSRPSSTPGSGARPAPLGGPAPAWSSWSCRPRRWRRSRSTGRWSRSAPGAAG